MSVLIVATDLTPRGDRAVARAFRLARERSARLILATAVDDDLPGEIAAALRSGAERRLAEIVAASPEAQEVEHEVRVLLGDPALAIATLAQTEGARLLVLGSHRPRPFADSIRETTMQRIVRQSACPVLVVSKPPSGAYRMILAAVDFSPASAAALRAAAECAPGAAMTAVHAIHVPFRGLMPNQTAAPFMREARAAEADWRRTETLPDRLGPVDLIEGPAQTVIAQALLGSQADLIAIGAHARTGLTERLLGSFATMLLEDPPADILVARPH